MTIWLFSPQESLLVCVVAGLEEHDEDEEDDA